FRHHVHVFGADLHLNRDTVRAYHRGVQRLIAVRFWNGDIVFHTPRTRLIEAMHLTEHAVAGIQIVDDNAEGVNIHDRVETLLFHDHFAVNGVEMLLASAYATGNTGFLQTAFDFREDFLDHLFTVTACGFDYLFDHPITVWVQRFKAQLFKLGFDVMDT